RGLELRDRAGDLRRRREIGRALPRPHAAAQHGRVAGELAAGDPVEALPLGCELHLEERARRVADRLLARRRRGRRLRHLVRSERHARRRRIAGVAEAVVVAVELIGVWDRSAVVFRVEDAVAVGIAENLEDGAQLSVAVEVTATTLEAEGGGNAVDR